MFAAGSPIKMNLATLEIRSRPVPDYIPQMLKLFVVGQLLARDVKFYALTAVQNLHRFAAFGMSLKHSGQARVVGSGIFFTFDIK